MQIYLKAFYKGADILFNNFQPILNNPNIFLPLIIWALVWKGLALWRAARLKQVGWYIALIIIIQA